MADFREMTGCFECVSRPGREEDHGTSSSPSWPKATSGSPTPAAASSILIPTAASGCSPSILACVPLAGHIRRVLDERPAHRAPASRFRDELEDHMSEQFADQTLRSVTSWGRYGESLAYDEATGVFSLDKSELTAAIDVRSRNRSASQELSRGQGTRMHRS